MLGERCRRRGTLQFFIRMGIDFTWRAPRRRRRFRRQNLRLPIDRVGPNADHAGE